MDQSNEYYMQLALSEAQIAYEQGEIPVGAVVVCNGNVIAKAHNYTEHLFDVTAHAEMQVITMATNMLGGKYLTNCTIYVTLEPCPMCAAALSWAQISQIIYGATDDKHGYHLYSPSLLHPKTQVVSGVLAGQCASLLTKFFQQKR